MLETYFNRIVEIWVAGGWVMIPLAVLSVMIYTLAARMILYFNRRGYGKVAANQWQSWVENPRLGEGELGEIIRYTQDDVRTPDDIHCRFAEVIGAKIPSIDRRLSTLNTLIAAAPLLGLLGTVFGMLVTFKALAVGGGKVTDMMAAGISQALFPPEVGLCVALPGLMLVQFIKRKRHEYEAFLAQLESCTIQYYKGRFGRRDEANRTVFVSRPKAAPRDAAKQAARRKASEQAGALLAARPARPTPQPI
jgi:biopolymer transport protein ExbB